MFGPVRGLLFFCVLVLMLLSCLPLSRPAKAAVSNRSPTAQFLFSEDQSYQVVVIPAGDRFEHGILITPDYGVLALVEYTSPEKATHDKHRGHTDPQGLVYYPSEVWIYRLVDKDGNFSATISVYHSGDPLLEDEIDFQLDGSPILYCAVPVDKIYVDFTLTAQ